MKRLLCLVWLVCCSAYPALSQGRSTEPKRKSSSESLHELKEDANEALKGVDKGVHKGAAAAKDGATAALDALDHGVHKVVGKEK